MKKISKLLIGTNNKGKYKEIKDLLPKYIKTHSTTEFKLKSPKEDGLTFRENSIIKAKHFSKRANNLSLRFIFVPETIGAISYLKLNLDRTYLFLKTSILSTNCTKSFSSLKFL